MNHPVLEGTMGFTIHPTFYVCISAEPKQLKKVSRAPGGSWWSGASTPSYRLDPEFMSTLQGSHPCCQKTEFISKVSPSPELEVL